MLEHDPDRLQIVTQHYNAFEQELQGARRPAAIRERIRRLFEEAGFVSPDNTPSPQVPGKNAPTAFRGRGTANH
jgi:hypothetical protein